MGCLMRLGCLGVLIVAGFVAYLTRDHWMDRLPGREPRIEAPRSVNAPGGDSAPPPSGSSATAAAPTADGWMPLTQAGANRTREALQKLSTPRGPVFVTLAGGDVASYVFLQIAKQMPASTDSFVARVDEDRIRLRARMKTSDLGGVVTGVLGRLLGDRERVEMAGSLRIIGPGQGEFRVEEVRIKDVGLPGPVITRLVDAVTSGPRPAGLHENGLPVAVPSYIGDVRVSNGRITLYKNVQ